MTTFNEAAYEAMQERVADLEEEVVFWRSRAEQAIQGLRFAMTSLESYEGDLAELRRQLEFSQELLDGAVSAMERLS